MGRVLISISSFPPNERYESFYLTELAVLRNSFDELICVYDTPLNNISTKLESKNIYSRYLSTRLELWKSVYLIFNIHFLKEMVDLIKSDNFSFVKAKIALGSIINAQRIKKNIYQVVHPYLKNYEVTIFSYWANDNAIALSFLSLPKTKIKLITRAHGYDVLEERNKKQYLPFRKLIFSKLDKVLFVSDHGKNYSEYKFGKYNSYKTAYIPVKGPTQLREKKPEETLLLVSCSTINEIKRIDRIIDLLSETNNLKILWVHFGDGPKASQIEELATTRLAQLENVTFEFKGRVENSEILEFYRTNRVEAFINTSDSEGLPVSIIEACAHGIPIIASDVGGTSEVVKAKHNGFLIDFTSSNNRDIRLDTMLSEINQKYSEFSKNSANVWKSKFSPETSGEVLRSFFLN